MYPKARRPWSSASAWAAVPSRAKIDSFSSRRYFSESWTEAGQLNPALRGGRAKYCVFTWHLELPPFLCGWSPLVVGDGARRGFIAALDASVASTGGRCERRKLLGAELRIVSETLSGGRASETGCATPHDFHLLRELRVRLQPLGEGVTLAPPCSAVDRPGRDVPPELLCGVL